MLVLVCGGANAIADIGDKRTKRHFVIVVPNDVDSNNQDNIIMDAADGDDIDRAMESSSVCNGWSMFPRSSWRRWLARW